MPRQRGDEATAFQFRMSPTVRGALERAAAASGKSLNAEIHDRLEQSLAATPADETVAGLVRGLAEMLTVVGERAARTAGVTDWTRDPWAYHQAKVAAGIVLQALRPPGEVTPPAVELDPEVVAQFSEAAARDAVTAIRERLGAHTADYLLGPADAGSFGAGPRAYQRLLGSELVDRIEANRLTARSKASRP
jgi:hypothetical protein